MKNLCPECDTVLKAGARKCWKCKWEPEAPEPKTFIACGLCLGTGMVQVRNKVTEKTGVMICGCANGALKDPHTTPGRTWARWGWQHEAEWEVLKRDTKEKPRGPEYQEQAKALAAKFMAREGDQSVLADELYEFAMRYPKSGWWDVANLAMTRYYRSKGFQDAEIKACLPKEP